MGYKYDVFISYSRKDSDAAKAVCRELERAGLTYFIDKEGILSGQLFVDIIVQSIRNSRLFLFLASNNSYSSPIIMDEIFAALDNVQENTIQLVTYIIDDSELPESLRFRLRRYNWRTLQQHPIAEVLIPDIIQLLGYDELSVCNIIEFDGKKGYGDRNGNMRIPPKWKSAAPFKDGLAAVEDFNGHYGHINLKGEIVYPPKWKYAGSFSCGLARVLDKRGKWGYVDKSGDMKIPCRWKDAESFSRDLACVMNNDNKYGYIDINGSEIIPCKWEEAYGFYETDSARVKNNAGFWGFIDMTGEIKCPCIWSSAEDFKMNDTDIAFAKVISPTHTMFQMDKNGNLYTMESRFVTSRFGPKSEQFLNKYMSLTDYIKTFQSEIVEIEHKSVQSVLVVSSDEGILKQILLFAPEYEQLFIHKTSGVEALLMIDDKERQIDLILTTSNADEISGSEFVMIIKEICTIPVVAILNKEDRQNVKAMNDAGCDGIIYTPLTRNTIKETVNKYSNVSQRQDIYDSFHKNGYSLKEEE